MTVAQITLSDSRTELLHRLAEKTGRREDELLNEVVDKAFAQLEQSEEKGDWRDNLRKLRGVWKDRDDLPDFEAMRREFDRSFD
jgi:hypothetical protein